VADGFEPWRGSIVSIIEEDPELEVIHESSDGVEAVQACLELQPDLVVLDVALPRLNGLEVARLIREGSPGSKILFVSVMPSRELIREALRVGAAGYITKMDAGGSLLRAVKAVMADREFLSFTVLPESGTGRSGGD
jgi:DNA-binding NarL/FixJ family response regulator